MLKIETELWESVSSTWCRLSLRVICMNNRSKVTAVFEWITKFCHFWGLNIAFKSQRKVPKSKFVIFQFQNFYFSACRSIIFCARFTEWCLGINGAVEWKCPWQTVGFRFVDLCNCLKFVFNGCYFSLWQAWDLLCGVKIVRFLIIKFLLQSVALA